MIKYPSLILTFMVVFFSCRKEDTPVTVNFPIFDSIPNDTANLLTADPFDIQFDSTNRWLYFFEKNGDISIYNVATHTIERQVSNASTIGYCDFGEYNGVKELYVPGTDGYLYIYNALTLEKITQIKVGHKSSCVIFNNDILYVATDARADSPIKFYRRSAKQLISANGSNAPVRLIKVPNTSIDFLEITTTTTPVDLWYYSFQSNGAINSKSNDSYHGDYDLNANICAFFPSGDKYITGTSGTVYFKNMTYLTTLSSGETKFTSFAFDNTSKKLYAGTYDKRVEVYNYAGFDKERSIATKGYPFRLFEDQTGFICVSYVSNWDANTSNNIRIEHIE